MKNEYYEEPDLKITNFANVDVLKASDEDENELPPSFID